ncbi:hypothetical protein HAZT_HAZT009522 [Hyalella azteca]|uniref:Uncharacterized protein n=1 Tax=Hyalella azteca TaxID=294128 RepID=A0A6A0GQV6_HYAAZ|nr:hypothetical protein HAZT_HAZT009522 [Hyalella azteca]
MQDKYDIFICVHRDYPTAIISTGKPRGLASVAIFTALVYARAWTDAPFAAVAHRIDLALLKAHDAFEHIDPALAKAARNNMEGPLWHLLDESISLSLFDDKELGDQEEDRDGHPVERR